MIEELKNEKISRIDFIKKAGFLTLIIAGFSSILFQTPKEKNHYGKSTYGRKTG